MKGSSGFLLGPWNSSWNGPEIVCAIGFAIMCGAFLYHAVYYCDAPYSWQMGFQDPAALPAMDVIIDFHNHTMFFMVIGFTLVYWILYECVQYIFHLKIILKTSSTVNNHPLILYAKSEADQIAEWIEAIVEELIKIGQNSGKPLTPEQIQWLRDELAGKTYNELKALFELVLARYKKEGMSDLTFLLLVLAIIGFSALILYIFYRALKKKLANGKHK